MCIHVDVDIMSTCELTDTHTKKTHLYMCAHSELGSWQTQNHHPSEVADWGNLLVCILGKPVGVHTMNTGELTDTENPYVCMSWTQGSWQTPNSHTGELADQKVSGVHILYTGKLADGGNPLMCSFSGAVHHSNDKTQCLYRATLRSTQ